MRLAITVIVGVVVIGATLTDSCNDNDGPSWERCTSPLGNATLEWRGDTAWIPYLIGVIVGCVTWFLLGFARRLWVEAHTRLETTGESDRRARDPARMFTVGSRSVRGLVMPMPHTARRQPLDGPSVGCHQRRLKGDQDNGAGYLDVKRRAGKWSEAMTVRTNAVGDEPRMTDPARGFR